MSNVSAALMSIILSKNRFSIQKGEARRVAEVAIGPSDTEIIRAATQLGITHHTSRLPSLLRHYNKETKQSMCNLKDMIIDKLEHYTTRITIKHTNIPAQIVMDTSNGKTPEIQSLTSLRGVAAVMVMFYHLAHRHVGIGPFRTLLNHGYLCVDLFFVLSGLVMAMTYANDFRHGLDLTRFRVFIARRLARIYPLYAVVTLFWIALILSGKVNDIVPHYFWTAVLVNVVLIQNWVMTFSIVGNSWSVSAEMAAYMLFPWLARVTLFRGTGMALAAVAVGCAMLISVTMLPDWFVTLPAFGRTGPLDVFLGVGPGPLLRCLAEFTFGLVTFRICSNMNTKLWHCLSRLDWVVGAALIGLFMCPGSDLMDVALMPLLILVLLPEKGLLAKLLKSAPLYTLGVWSYAIYLIHVRTFRLTGLTQAFLTSHHVPGSGFLGVLVGSSVAIAAAAVLHYTIERPGRRVVRRLLGA
jgi:peptidoglycan/LPS O-acetylase OafA/YrhL